MKRSIKGWCLWNAIILFVSFSILIYVDSSVFGNCDTPYGEITIKHQHCESATAMAAFSCSNYYAFAYGEYGASLTNTALTAGSGPGKCTVRFSSGFDSPVNVVIYEKLGGCTANSDCAGLKECSSGKCVCPAAHSADANGDCVYKEQEDGFTTQRSPFDKGCVSSTICIVQCLFQSDLFNFHSCRLSNSEGRVYTTQMVSKIVFVIRKTVFITMIYYYRSLTDFMNMSFHLLKPKARTQLLWYFYITMFLTHPAHGTVISFV